MFVHMLHIQYKVFVSVVSHHSTDHPAKVDRVCSLNVVFVFVTEVLWGDLQELQTCLQDPRLILHIWKHKYNCTVFLPANHAIVACC